MEIKIARNLIVAALAVSGAAFAQTKAPEPDYTLSFNAGAVTDYRYRGISQTRFGPALQAGADFSHKSGLYVGTWASTIKWIKDAGGNSDFEWDIYGGYKFKVQDLVDVDVGVLRYQYVDNNLPVSANTTELYAAATYSYWTLKYSHSVSNLFGFFDSKSSGYLDASGTFDLGNGISFVPHLGRQWVTHNNAASYYDASATFTKDFGNGFSASGAFVGTDARKTVYFSPSGKALGRPTIVLGAKYTF